MNISRINLVVVFITYPINMKKKWWVILITIIVLILWFSFCKIRSYVKNTYVCHEIHSSCVAIMYTEYYYENHITCPKCPTFWEYLVKWIKSLDVNGVISCCSKWVGDEVCGCGENVIKNYQDCECSIEPTANADWNLGSSYDDMIEVQNSADDISKGCIIYFDWCNTYYYEEGDHTENLCLEYEEPECLKYKDKID